MITGDHHVVASQGGEEPLRTPGPVDAIGAGVHVLSENAAGPGDLCGADAGIPLGVGGGPHAVVLHVGDQLVTPHRIGVVIVADDRQPVEVVDHTDLVAVFVDCRQPQSPPGEFFVDQVLVLGVTTVEEVVPLAAPEIDHAQVGLDPVDSVTALGVGVAADIEQVETSLRVEGEIPHPEESVGFLDHAAPGLGAFAFPRAIGHQHRSGMLLHPVHDPLDVLLLGDLVIVDHQVQLRIVMVLRIPVGRQEVTLIAIVRRSREQPGTTAGRADAGGEGDRGGKKPSTCGSWHSGHGPVVHWCPIVGFRMVGQSHR